MGYLPADHGVHSDLGADHHGPYQTDADGDALYPPKAGGAGSSGTWTINVTGSANTANTATSSTNANDASSVDGQVWSWSDIGLQTYFWASSDGNNVYVTWEGNWARATHNHHGQYGIIHGVTHIDVGVLSPATAYGPWTFGHGLQGNAPKMAVVTATYDDGVNSVGTSVGNLWDGTNVLICARNYNTTEAEGVALCLVSWV